MMDTVLRVFAIVGVPTDEILRALAVAAEQNPETIEVQGVCKVTNPEILRVRKHPANIISKYCEYCGCTKYLQ